MTAAHCPLPTAPRGSRASTHPTHCHCPLPVLRRLMPWMMVGVLLSIWLLPRPAEAGNLLAWLAGEHKRPAAYRGSPTQVFGPRPSPHVYPEYNVSSPWYGYGFGVPAYNWGYFGARYRPAVTCHKGYYGDFTQWGYRQGY